MDSRSFGETHFGSAQLGDRRRTRRLIRCADLILRHPRGSLPEKINQPAALKGLSRLIAERDVTHERILAAHHECVLERIAAVPGDVLLIHDATELDYTGLDSITADLGILGGKGRHRGFICHHSLAVAARSREVLGLTSQILHCRQPAPKNEKRDQGRKKPQRERRRVGIAHHFRPADMLCPCPNTAACFLRDGTVGE